MLQASYQTVYQGRVVKKTDFLANSLYQKQQMATHGLKFMIIGSGSAFDFRKICTLKIRYYFF